MLNVSDMSWVRSDENFVLRMPLVLRCICYDWSSASDIWWRTMLSASMTDLSIMTPNWVGAMAPVSIAICSVRRAAKCSSILRRIESSDIRHQDWVSLGLGLV